MSLQQLVVWTTVCTTGIKWGPTEVDVVQECASSYNWPLFPFPFLPSLESNKDRMMEGKDQACFQVQLHPIISYLFSLIPRQSSGFNPAPVFSAYKAELCLWDWVCPSTLAPSDLHTHCTGALKIAEKQEINSHKWVQANEPGTHLKCSPQWARYPEPEDFNTVTVAHPHWPVCLCVPNRETSELYSNLKRLLKGGCVKDK